MCKELHTYLCIVLYWRVAKQFLCLLEKMFLRIVCLPVMATEWQKEPWVNVTQCPLFPASCWMQPVLTLAGWFAASSLSGSNGRWRWGHHCSPTHLHTRAEVWSWCMHLIGQACACVCTYEEVWACARVGVKEAQREGCMAPSTPRQICHFWL